MPTYKAPLRDMNFLINEVLDFPSHYARLSSGGEATPDMVEAILRCRHAVRRGARTAQSLG